MPRPMSYWSIYDNAGHPAQNWQTVKQDMFWVEHGHSILHELLNPCKARLQLS